MDEGLEDNLGLSIVETDELYTLRARVAELELLVRDLERAKLTIGGVEARYPTYTKMLAIIEIHSTPAGVCIIVQP
jgi:hypothetical protein